METCEIVWTPISSSPWGSITVGYFRAEVARADGASEIGRSQAFATARADGLPHRFDRQHNGYLKALVDQLVADGWELTSDAGSNWWSYRFCRLVA